MANMSVSVVDSSAAGRSTVCAVVGFMAAGAYFDGQCERVAPGDVVVVSLVGRQRLSVCELQVYAVVGEPSQSQR